MLAKSIFCVPCALLWRNLLVLLCLCAFAANSAVAAPRIECDEPVFEFGTLVDQKEIRHEFLIWNRGDSELNISKVRACCGMKASMDSLEIAPGSNSICRVIFDLSNRTGEQNKQVLIGSNDPEQPYLDLRLKGFRQTAFKMTPDTIQFGNLTSGREQVQTLSVTHLLDVPVTLQSVSSSVNHVEAELVESSDRNWVVRVTAKPMTVQTQLKGMICLNFSSGRVNVPFSGTVESVFKSVPERITVSSGAAEKVERLVALSSSDGREFTVVSAGLVNAEGTVEVAQLRPDRWQCHLSILPASIRQDATLRIQTSCKDQPEIIIPVETVN